MLDSLIVFMFLKALKKQQTIKKLWFEDLVWGKISKWTSMLIKWCPHIGFEFKFPVRARKVQTPHPEMTDKVSSHAQGHLPLRMTWPPLPPSPPSGPPNSFRGSLATAHPIASTSPSGPSHSRWSTKCRFCRGWVPWLVLTPQSFQDKHAFETYLFYLGRALKLNANEITNIVNLSY